MTEEMDILIKNGKSKNFLKQTSSISRILRKVKNLRIIKIEGEESELKGPEKLFKKLSID